MKMKAIIFYPQMVLAILEDRKTMTRRVLKQPAEMGATGSPISVAPYATNAPEFGLAYYWRSGGSWNSTSPIKIRHAVGDILWVKENIKFSAENGNHYYEADNKGVGTDIHAALRKNPISSFYMPKLASRITLEVTAVKVERVRDITDDDALAEGVATAIPPIAGIDIDIDGHYWPGGPKRMFKELWTSIHGEDAWERNDWVAAYTFRRVTA